MCARRAACTDVLCEECLGLAMKLADRAFKASCLESPDIVARYYFVPDLADVYSNNVI